MKQHTVSPFGSSFKSNPLSYIIDQQTSQMQLILFAIKYKK